jgi:hypothetical protein
MTVNTKMGLPFEVSQTDNKDIRKIDALLGKI